MDVICPPQRLGESEGPTLFIAGSIEMGTASRWQDEVIQHLADHQGVLLNPRRKEWDSTWEQTIENPHFKEQVVWELQGIEQSDYVAFYFDPATKSPITLFELGLAIGLGKQIHLACPHGFWRKGNVDVIASRNSLIVHTSLAAIIDALQATLSNHRKEHHHEEKD